MPKVDVGLLQELVEILSKSPRAYNFLRTTWTQKMVARVLAGLTGTYVSKRTIGRMLDQLRARRGRPRPTLRCPLSGSARRHRIRKIERLLARLPRAEVALYVDEVDIHMNPRIGFDWMLPGRPKNGVTPGVNKKRYIAGALNAKSGEILWVSSGRKKSDLFINLLSCLRTHHRRSRKIHLILTTSVSIPAGRRSKPWIDMAEYLSFTFCRRTLRHSTGLSISCAM